MAKICAGVLARMNDLREAPVQPSPVSAAKAMRKIPVPVPNEMSAPLPAALAPSPQLEGKGWSS